MSSLLSPRLYLLLKSLLFIVFLDLHLHLSNNFLRILSPEKSGKVVVVSEVTRLERIIVVCGEGWTQMQTQDTALQRTKNPFIQVNKNKHKIIPTGGENKEQSKLKNKAPSRGRFQARSMDTFTGNKSTHVEHRS